MWKNLETMSISSEDVNNLQSNYMTLLFLGSSRVIKNKLNLKEVSIK